jgi:predicted nucleotidyltransferase
MDKKEKIISVVKKHITRIDPNVKIILFGSRARNEAKKDSDWDFLILTNSKVTRDLKNQISDELFEAELETEEVLTGIIQNTTIWEKYSNTPIYKNILQDGIEV